MTSFVHIDVATRHVGAERLEAAAQAAGHLRRVSTGTRGLATMLLSAVVAAILVAAYEIMDSVAEGQLLVIWIAMWAVAFASLGLFAGSARNLAARMKASADAWSRSMAEAKSDQRLWAIAKKDERVMRDLQAAIKRGDASSDAARSPLMAAATAFMPHAEQSSLRAYHRLYI